MFRQTYVTLALGSTVLACSVVLVGCSFSPLSKEVPGTKTCTDDSVCEPGELCSAGVCATASAGISPTISSISGTSVSQPGRVGTGLVVAGTNLDKTSVVQLFDKAGQLVADLLISSASAASVSASFPMATSAAVVPGETYTLQLTTSGGDVARQAIQFLQGESGPAGQQGTPGSTGPMGPTGQQGGIGPMGPPGTNSQLIAGTNISITGTTFSTVALASTVNMENATSATTLRVANSTSTGAAFVGAGRSVFTSTIDDMKVVSINAQGEGSTGLEIIATDDSQVALEVIGKADLGSSAGARLPLRKIVATNVTGSLNLAIAVCPASSHVIGGGCGASVSGLYLEEARPAYAAQQDYRCRWSGNGTAGTLKAYAICLDSFGLAPIGWTQN